PHRAQRREALRPLAPLELGERPGHRERIEQLGAVALAQQVRRAIDRRAIARSPLGPPLGSRPPVHRSPPIAWYFSRNCIRARCSHTQTVSTRAFISCAISSPLLCSSSKRISTERYFSES